MKVNQKFLENEFEKVKNEFLNHQKKFEDSLSLHGYSVDYKFDKVKNYGERKKQIRYIVTVYISNCKLDGSTNINAKVIRSFSGCLLNISIKNGKYLVKSCKDRLFAIVLNKTIKNISNRSTLSGKNFLYELFLLCLNLKNRISSKKNVIEIFGIILFLIFMIIMGIISAQRSIAFNEMMGWWP